MRRWARRVLRPLLALTAILLAGAPAPATAQPPRKPAVYYVSPRGDATDCSRARPCALASAQQAVRREIAGGMDRDVRVLLTGGTYRMTRPLRLGPADSGRAGHTVTWASMSGQRAVFSGGTPITGWHRRGDGVWTATVPGGVNPRQLFVDGRRAVRARGAGCPASVCAATKRGITGSQAGQWHHPTDVEAVIRIRWRNYHCRIAGVRGELVSLVQPCWRNSSSGTRRTGPGWDATTVDSAGYEGVAYFENAPELLDRPGEFAFDAATRKLSYRPRSGEDVPHARAVTPEYESLLRMQGAHDVTISGLGFRYAGYHQPDTPQGYAGTQAGLTLTGWSGPVDHAGRYYTKPAAAVRVRAGRNVVVRDAAFGQLGGAGAVFEAGTRDSSVLGSKFTDLSSGALYFGGTEPNPPQELRGIGNTVAHNVIRNVGVEYSDAVGVWAGYEAGLTVDHNTLEHLPYSGISVGWGWNQPVAQHPVLRDNRITNNRVIDMLRPEMGQHDGGAIYTQGPQPGTVISGNYLDRAEYPAREFDGNGVYLDEQSSHIRVEGNVVTRVGYKWVSNWADYGIDNHVSRNWTDTTAPALSGKGSTMTRNRTALASLPRPAVEVATAAGVGGEVEPLPPDVARNRPSRLSSTDGPHEADLAVDGSTMTTAQSRAEHQPYWQADLGAPRGIRAVELWNSDCCWPKFSDYYVLASDTPFVSDRLGEVLHQPGVSAYHRRGPADRPGRVEIARPARYIRIQLAGTGPLVLAEFKALTED